MDNTIKVTTRFSAHEIRQTVTDPRAPSVAQAITEIVMRLREEAIRAALKELGWISPEERQGMALVPRYITAESGHKAGMMGDFAVTAEDCCYECEGLGHDDNDDECDVCQGRGEVRRLIGIPWPTIKEIHSRIVEIAEGGEW